MQVVSSDQVKDALGSTTVLLVFVTVLFNAKYAEIRAKAASSRPAAPAAVRAWRQELWDCLVYHLGPVLLVSAGATLVFLPVVKTILTERKPAYWDNLDFGATTFLFVFVVVAGLAGWAAIRACQLFGKYREASAYLDKNK
jgi:hypothetical protein